MQDTDFASRPVSRRLARELTSEELSNVGGGEYCTVCIATCDPTTDSNGETSDTLHYHCQTTLDQWA
jgi:hypothetical protein